MAGAAAPGAASPPPAPPARRGPAASSGGRRVRRHVCVRAGGCLCRSQPRHAARPPRPGPARLGPARPGPAGGRKVSRRSAAAAGSPAPCLSFPAGGGRLGGTAVNGGIPGAARGERTGTERGRDKKRLPPVGFCPGGFWGDGGRRMGRWGSWVLPAAPLWGGGPGQGGTPASFVTHFSIPVPPGKSAAGMGDARFFPLLDVGRLNEMYLQLPFISK